MSVSVSICSNKIISPMGFNCTTLVQTGQFLFEWLKTQIKVIALAIQSQQSQTAQSPIRNQSEYM